MVKEIQGSGGFMRDVIQVHEIESRSFRTLRFVQDPSNDSAANRERSFLDALSSFPEFDARSFLIRDVRDTTGKRLHILLVPRNCPELLPDDGFYDGIKPNEGETFVVDVWKNSKRKKSYRRLVVVDNPESAARIAKRDISEKSIWYRGEMETDVYSVTPDEFIQEAKKLIDQGQFLPPFITRFADLREYQERVRRQSTVNTPIFP